MRRLQWTKRASANLVDLLQYYREIDPSLGTTLRLRVVAAVRPIVETPGIGSPVGQHGARKWRAKRTPFLLIYRILPSGTVEIVSVHHIAQDWHSG